MVRLWATREQANKQLLTLRTKEGRQSYMVAMTIFGVAVASCGALGIGIALLPVIKQISGGGP